MNRMLIFLLSLLLCIGLISGCASTGDTQFNDFDSTTIIPLSVGENISQFELRITCADSRLTYTYGDATNEHLYAIEVVEIQEPERANNTLQMFIVSSGLEDADKIISVFDINYDNYNDIIVKTYQTPHSAACYSAYRWIPEKGRFEAEPFFEYQCSGQPELMDKDMLVTSDVTLTNVEWTLYHLDEQGYYQPTRTMICERYDNISCAVIRSDTSQLLYSCEYSFDEELPTEEIMRLNSWFFFGKPHSFVNRTIDLAERYCLYREDGRYGFGDIISMLSNEDNLRNSEKAYTDGKDSRVVCDGVLAAGMEIEEAGMCRVDVVCLTYCIEDESSGLYSYEEKLLSLSIGVEPGTDEIHVYGVDKSIAVDDTSWFAAERCENGEFAFFAYDSERNKAQLTEWRCEVLPGVSIVDENIVQLWMGVGTGFWSCAYYNTDTGEFSSCYTNAYYLDNEIILIADRTSEIRIVNAFDESSYSHSLYPDFAPVAVPSGCCFECELLDSTHIKLAYCDEEWQYVERICEIPDICK